MKITGKVKKFFGGNWGKPTKCEQKSKVDYSILEQEVPKYNKKKKKIKKEYNIPWTICPFCKNPLRQLEVNHDNNVYYVLNVKRYDNKCDCGAKVMPDCPACHRNTWFKDGIYKHQGYGCGFEGERKWVSS